MSDLQFPFYICERLMFLLRAGGKGGSVLWQLFSPTECCSRPLVDVSTFVDRGRGFFSPADEFHSSVPAMQITCGWINNLLLAAAGQQLGQFLLRSAALARCSIFLRCVFSWSDGLVSGSDGSQSDWTSGTSVQMCSSQPCWLSVSRSLCALEELGSKSKAVVCRGFLFSLFLILFASFLFSHEEQP